MDAPLRTGRRPGSSAAERPGWRDAWLPGLLLVVGATELAWLGTQGWLASVALEAAAGVALVFRRRSPLLVALLVVGLLSLIPLTGTRMDDAAAPIPFIMLASFSLARWLPLSRAMPGLAAVVVVVGLAAVGVDARDQDWTDGVFVLSLLVPPFAFGRVVRRLDEQRQLLAAQQEVIREQAVQGERDRIARELHDVIAHSISAMVVQTAAAQDLVRTRPDRAAELLASVAETGRSALAETGRLLHLVRDQDGELGLEPAPSVRDLPALVQSFRDGGRDLEADLRLPEAPLPSGVDVSAYRVVQEALTNAARHADGPVRLSVLGSTDCLQIRCVNPIGGRTSTAAGSGLGLRGMEERVGMLGGTMHSTTSAGEFVLEVALPIPRGAS